MPEKTLVDVYLVRYTDEVFERALSAQLLNKVIGHCRKPGLRGKA